jgi:hypothetical protein
MLTFCFVVHNNIFHEWIEKEVGQSKGLLLFKGFRLG